MLKTLCVVAELAFASLPAHLRPMICQGTGAIYLMADNSTVFEGDSPAEWQVIIGPNRRVQSAMFNRKPVIGGKPRTMPAHRSQIVTDPNGNSAQ
jgi:hypothetical protein